MIQTRTLLLMLFKSSGYRPLRKCTLLGWQVGGPSAEGSGAEQGEARRALAHLCSPCDLPAGAAAAGEPPTSPLAASAPAATWRDPGMLGGVHRGAAQAWLWHQEHWHASMFQSLQRVGILS